MKEAPNEDIILQRIEDRYDPDGLVDCLGLDSHDIVEAFREYILANLHLFDDIGEEEHGPTY